MTRFLFNFAHWLDRTFSRIPARPKIKSCHLRLEALEERALLSISQFFPTDLRAFGDDVHPLGGSGPSGYTPSQIRHAYGFDQITFSGGIAGNGSGTTIAIVDAYDDPNIANDLHQFDVRFGLADPVFNKVSQTGGLNYPVANSGWISEIALDVEWAHAIAPGAHILLVEANSSSYSDLLTAVDYAAKQSGVVAVSMSWGSSEFSSQTYLDSNFVTPSGHQGVTFVVSSGDNGAPASYPATSPNVLTVGGTHVSLDSQGNILSESTWSGSGGGISQYEAQPSYQKGKVPQSASMRTSPDVAYDADPYTGFPVYDSYNNGSSAPWSQFGGTSDAAPQWAALIAIADQGRVLAGLGSLDGATQTLPMIYGMPFADFHDITSGSSTGSPNYSAAPGYDLTTGRGTPYANRVVANLVGSNTTPPQSPPSGPLNVNFVLHADNTVYGQKFDSNGNPVGNAFLVAFGSLKSISVTKDVSGNLVLFGIDPYLGHVWQLKFDANGNPTSHYYTPIWTMGTVESIAAGHDGHGNLELFAVDPFVHHVWAMKFDANDNPAGPFQLLSPGGVATNLTVGHDGTGNPLIFTVDPYFSQVQEMRFDANGDPVSDFYRPAASFAVKSIGLNYDKTGNPELFAIDPWFGHVFYLNLDANGKATSNLFLQAGTGIVSSIALGHDSNDNPLVFGIAPDYQMVELKLDSNGKPVADFFATGPSVVSVTSITVTYGGTGLPQLFGMGLGDDQIYEETFDASGNMIRSFFRVSANAVAGLAVSQ
jgi:hypothetical protein